MRPMTIPVFALLLLGGCRDSRHPQASGERALPPLPRGQELSALPDSVLEERLFDWTLHRIEVEDSLFEQDREILVRLPAGYLDLYATRLLEEELAEGGVAQVLGGTNRRFLGDAVAAYARFGADGHARLLRRAQRMLRHGHGIGIWKDDEDLIEQPPDSASRDLDRRLAALREDAPRLRKLWIRHHLNRFVQL